MGDQAACRVLDVAGADKIVVAPRQPAWAK
jgi:hypothetical protein